MIDITVIRGSGDSQGEDIVSTLFTSEAVVRQRGRNEIDARQPITPVQLRSVYRPGIRTGQTVRVMDALQGVTWYGKIISLDIAVEGPVVTASMEIDRV